MYGMTADTETRYYDAQVKQIVARAQAHILCRMFGATSFAVVSDLEIRLIFKHNSADGLSEETRVCVLNVESSPEANLTAIEKVLAEQRWYSTRRNGEQVLAYDPNAVQKKTSEKEGESQDVPDPLTTTLTN